MQKNLLSSRWNLLRTCYHDVMNNVICGHCGLVYDNSTTLCAFLHKLMVVRACTLKSEKLIGFFEAPSAFQQTSRKGQNQSKNQLLQSDTVCLTRFVRVAIDITPSFPIPVT